MMNCKKTLDYLQDYLDGDLKPELSSQIKDHLNECSFCRDEYRALRQVGVIFRSEKIPVPSEIEWQKTWTAIESQISENRNPLVREVTVLLDWIFMKLLNPNSLTTRMAYSFGLFILGISLGSFYLTPSNHIYQRVVKVEHEIQQVPVVQKEEVIKYMNREVEKLKVTEKIVEKPKVIYLANASFEPAPVFPAKEETEPAPNTQIPVCQSHCE